MEKFAAAITERNSMSFSLAYWILMLLWLVLGLRQSWPSPGPQRNFFPLGNTLLIFILLVLLGWKVFQAPLHP